MHTEIERKFLVCNDAWRKNATPIDFCQGYIYSDTECLVRVRTENTRAYLTIKGPKIGIGRAEFEYSIPQSDAQELLHNMAFQPLIYKTRHILLEGKHRWEIDEFLGDNNGLVLAEIELVHENEYFAKPAWLGKEVTHDARYRNASLARRPYVQWGNFLKEDRPLHTLVDL